MVSECCCWIDTDMEWNNICGFLLRSSKQTVCVTNLIINFWGMSSRINSNLLSNDTLSVFIPRWGKPLAWGYQLQIWRFYWFQTRAVSIFSPNSQQEIKSANFAKCQTIPSMSSLLTKSSCSRCFHPASQKSCAHCWVTGFLLYLLTKAIWFLDISVTGLLNKKMNTAYK